MQVLILSECNRLAWGYRIKRKLEPRKVNDFGFFVQTNKSEYFFLSQDYFPSIEESINEMTTKAEAIDQLTSHRNYETRNSLLWDIYLKDSSLLPSPNEGLLITNRVENRNRKNFVELFSMGKVTYHVLRKLNTDNTWAVDTGSGPSNS